MTEEIECYLLSALTTPTGSCFFTSSGYLYAPEYMENDAWHMEVTQLFRDAETYMDGLPAGEYTLSYYLNDQLGDCFSFTLSE